MNRALLALGSVCWLAACASSGEQPQEFADISKVAQVDSSFGPDFKVKEIPKTGIDPKLLASHRLPPGLRFDPADCAKFVIGQDMPPKLQGNMAAVAAEGKGNRFIVIAMQTSAPVPLDDPSRNCKRVGFTGGGMRGAVEVVEAPQIAGTRTLGVHRVVQTVVDGKPRSGETYTYTSHFGDYQVIVTANPLLVPDQPVAPVDTKRARDLLVKAVADIRG